MRSKIILLGLITQLFFFSCITTTNNESENKALKKVEDIDKEVSNLVDRYLNEPDILIEHLNELLGDKKDLYLDLYARIYISMGDYKGGKETLLRIPDLNNTPSMLKLLVICNMALKEDYTDLLERMLEIDGNSVFALNTLAEKLMSESSLDQAEKHLTKSYKFDHKVDKTKILLGDLALKRVDALGLNKKKVLTQRQEANIQSYYNLALDYYTLVENSFDPGYYVKLGNVNKKLGKKLEAVKAFNKAIEFEPDNIWNYYDRGKLYFYMGSNEMALKDFNKAYNLDKTHFFTNVFLGRVNFALDNNSDALYHYNIAMGMNPKYDPAYRDLSILAYLEGDKQLSLDYQILLYKKSSKRDPFIPLFLVNTLLELKRDREAKKILQNLVKYEKNSTMKGIYNYYLDPKRTGEEVLSEALATEDSYFRARMSYYISRALFREGVVGHSEVLLQDVAEAKVDFESKLAKYKLGE